MTASRRGSLARPELIEGDLVISIWPRFGACYEGSIAQLVDEGLIPDGLELPKWRDSKTWDDGAHAYRLLRARPPQHKGPESSWANGDWWMLDVSLVAIKGRGEQALDAAKLYELRRNLEAELWRQSPAGRWLQHRHLLAAQDRSFQCFWKRLIQGQAASGSRAAG